MGGGNCIYVFLPRRLQMKDLPDVTLPPEGEKVSSVLIDKVRDVGKLPCPRMGTPMQAENCKKIRLATNTDRPCKPCRQWARQLVKCPQLALLVAAKVPTKSMPVVQPTAVQPVIAPAAAQLVRKRIAPKVVATTAAQVTMTWKNGTVSNVPGPKCEYLALKHPRGGSVRQRFQPLDENSQCVKCGKNWKPGQKEIRCTPAPKPVRATRSNIPVTQTSLRSLTRDGWEIVNCWFDRNPAHDARRDGRVAKNTGEQPNPSCPACKVEWNGENQLQTHLWKQDASTGEVMYMEGSKESSKALLQSVGNFQHRDISCWTCSTSFEFPIAEQLRHKQLKYTDPRYCGDCRAARRKAEAEKRMELARAQEVKK
jgi:hypothetical protein